MDSIGLEFPLTRAEVMDERQTAAITLAQTILENPQDWGINDPDKCMEMATGLLAMKWLGRQGFIDTRAMR
jgi:hypothetical protein